MKKPNPNQSWVGNKRAEKARQRGDRAYVPGRIYQSPILQISEDARQVLRVFSEKNPFQNERFNRRAILKAPTRFCLIENPRESLRFLQKSAAAIRSAAVQEIHFDQSKTEWTGLSAEVLLCCLASTANSCHKVTGGTLGVGDEVLRKSWTVGTPAEIDPRREKFAKQFADVEQVRRRLTKRDYSGNFKNPNIRGAAVAHIVDYFDRCLRMSGYRLKDDAQQDIGNYMAEIAENVETHSGMYDWTVAGYLSTRDETGTSICEVALCNFGRSIADSFMSLSKEDVGRKDVDLYLKIHSQARLFGTQWNREALATVVALQEGVTSLRSKDPERGGGTGELINFFQNIARELGGEARFRPEMTLISGSTFIKFGNYRLKAREDGRKIIAFNESNSLHEAPDRSAVTALSDAFFPGTVFTLRFPLPQQFTQAIEP